MFPKTQVSSRFAKPSTIVVIEPQPSELRLALSGQTNTFKPWVQLSHLQHVCQRSKLPCCQEQRQQFRQRRLQHKARQRHMVAGCREIRRAASCLFCCLLKAGQKRVSNILMVAGVPAAASAACLALPADSRAQFPNRKIFPSGFQDCACAQATDTEWFQCPCQRAHCRVCRLLGPARRQPRPVFQRHERRQRQRLVPAGAAQASQQLAAALGAASLWETKPQGKASIWPQL